MRNIKTFQRFMISVMIAVNLLFYLLREGQTVMTAAIFSVLTGVSIFFSITFARQLRRKGLRMAQARKER